MPADTTLFAQILPMFTGQIERAATEALKHILEQSEPARNSLANMLLTAGVAVDSLKAFQTEASGDDGERVDLVCSDTSGTERVLIEAKFWAGLTDNQPNTYLARLPKEGHSVLLFIAPAQRMETLWPELCGRAQENHELTVLSESGDLRNVIIDGSERKMMATSWRAVLEQMDARASIAGDSAAVTDISQLRGLTERMDADAFLPIHSDELGQEFPRRMLNLVQLVDDATQRAIVNGWADAAGLRITPQWHGYGRYFRLYGVVVWFGIDFRHWAGQGESPIWVHSQDGKWSDPIYLRTGVEYPVVLDFAVEQLDIIGQQLKELSGKQ